MNIKTSFKLFLKSNYDSRATLVVLLFVSLARMLLEISQLEIPSKLYVDIFMDFFIFYLTMFWSFTLLLSLVIKTPFERVGNIVNVGLMFGILPPLIDFVFATEQKLTYKYFSQITLTLFAPEQPIGESITLWLLILSIGFLIFAVTQSYKKSFVGSVGAYFIIQTLSFILISIARFSSSYNKTFYSSIAFLVLSLFIYIGLSFKKFHPSLKRLNHGLPHFSLVLVGLAWTKQNLLFSVEKGIFVLFLVFVLLVHNDYYDKLEDTYDGRTSSINYQDIIWTSLFGVLAIVSFFFKYPFILFTSGIFLLAGYLYHHEAIRLKERFCLSYKIEGIWALMAFLTGAIGQSGFPKGMFYISLLIFGGGTLLSIPKDWKDIESDRRAGIPTYYVIFMQKGFTAEKIHFVIISIIALGLLFLPTLLTFLKITFVQALPIYIAGAIPIYILFSIKNRKQAIEYFMWGITFYLFILAITLV